MPIICPMISGCYAPNIGLAAHKLKHISSNMILPYSDSCRNISQHGSCLPEPSPTVNGQKRIGHRHGEGLA
jgi:hypothetical protein